MACTRFCERLDLAHVGGTKNPDIDAIAELNPDLVVLDREENRKEDHDALVALGIATEALHIASLDDVEPELGRLAQRLGVQWQPEPLPSPEGLASPARPRGLPGRPRAFVPIWRRPYMTIGEHTYGTSLLERCGVEVAFSELPDAYPVVDAEGLADADIDFVLAPTEPYSWQPRHLDDLAAYGPTYLIDGQDLFWWGTRTPGAIVRIAQTIERALALPSERVGDAK